VRVSAALAGNPRLHVAELIVIYLDIVSMERHRTSLADRRRAREIRMDIEARPAALEARLRAAEDQLAIFNLLDGHGPMVDSGSSEQVVLRENDRRYILRAAINDFALVRPPRGLADRRAVQPHADRNRGKPRSHAEIVEQ
jgi:hypothetical protein